MSSRVESARDAGVAAEQKYVGMLYGKIDELRERMSQRRAAALMENDQTPGRRSQRDNVTSMYASQLSRLDAIETGLCFGRLDFDGDERRYIGRIGLFEENENRSPLLIDWRAPAARQFYTATAANPDGVRLRRHIRTSHRTVTGISDEVLDLAAQQAVNRAAASDSVALHSDLTSEAALLAALDAERTGRMRDIVETIQVEQDEIIRSSLDGVLVVEGGPGTGKTAVALHRAAYLLYEHRERLAKRGVLLIGPNTTFLRYIGDVLPGLAETDVLLRTIGDLFPGVSADRQESAQAAAIKGAESMVEVMSAAVADRQRLPDTFVDMDTEYGKLVLNRHDCALARGKARASGKRHNPARPIFVAEVVKTLAEQVAERIGADPLGGENLLEEADVAEIGRELRAEPDVQAVLDWLWPDLTPQQLLAGLLGTDSRIASAAPELTEQERQLLIRPPRSGWSVADVPLLDEAAELLGHVDDGANRAKADAREKERAAYAQGVLDIFTGSRSIDLEDEDDPEILMATDLLDAALLGDRQSGQVFWSTAERAAADRTWTFGHIIVDEAQELSPMAWRMLMRRSVSRSMTVVGDLAQNSELAGITSWRDTLEPYVGGRWRHRELTISYRTPSEIMALAAKVLADIDPQLRAPRAARSTGVEPWEETVASQGFTSRLGELAGVEREKIGAGRLGVIVPTAQLGEASSVAVPGDGPAGAEQGPVTVLTVRQAKGLEFDSVIVVDPEGIVAESARGHNDLYVALTRATQRLGILHLG